jgi:AcrR family transcriptional regulator
MGRRARFSKRGIEEATLELVAEGGPRAATVAAIADRVGAPTGSIYHRYGSRDLLLAELWMGVVEAYQDGFVEALGGDDTLAAATRAAQYMPCWVRSHMLEARLLLLHRREDFISGHWPDALAHRAEALEGQMVRALRRFCRQHFGNLTRESFERARFALLDAPYGAVRWYVQAGSEPPTIVDQLAAETVRALLKRS